MRKLTDNEATKILKAFARLPTKQIGYEVFKSGKQQIVAYDLFKKKIVNLHQRARKLFKTESKGNIK